MNNKMLTKLALPIVLVGGFLLSDSFFTLKEWEKGLQFQFGRIVKEHTEPGLHMKVPFIQNVRKFDGRIHTLETKPEPFLTSEKKNLIVDTFVKWKVKDARTYYTSVQGNPIIFNQRLEPIVKNNFRAAFGKRDVQTVVGGTVEAKIRHEESDKRLVFDNPEDVLAADESVLREINKSDVEVVIKSKEVEIAEIAGQKVNLNNTVRREIEDNIQAALIIEAGKYGVEIVDVRINGVELPDDVTESVFTRMRRDREKVATELRSKGEAAYIQQAAQADRNRTVMLAEAYEKAEVIRGEGDAKAAEIYANAYGQDRDFYEFYRSLEAYKKAFEDKNDLFILDPNSKFFKHFSE